MKLHSLALTAVALALSACGKEAPPPEKPRAVLTQIVGGQSAEGVVRYSGEIRSRTEQSLGFRIAGKITERQVDAGATVKAGQVLARLDPSDAALSASAADAQRQLAEAEAHRYRELKEKNFVSQAALDARETTLKANRAQADLARNQADYTTLRADQPGVVAQVLGEVGQVVTPGQAVFRVSRPDQLEVAIAIPESRLEETRKASSAEVTLWNDGARTYKARLREISAVADPVTRTYAARVAIIDADPAVALGMTANVQFSAAAAAANTEIPLAAVFQKDGKPAVWTVDADGRVKLRSVDIARFTESAARVAGGLKAGERIVIAGVHKLAEGELIRIAEVPATAVAK